MNRYRQPTNPPNDDLTGVEGDVAFVGINNFDAGEQLEPGECQSAVNIDFSQQNASTRGGFVCLPAIGNAPPALKWKSRTIPGGHAIPTSVAYGAGLFVVIFSDSTSTDVITSTDGINWSNQTTPTGHQWLSLVFGSIFVAVSNIGTTHEVMTSRDGITWTLQTNPGSANWASVAYGNGLYVAVASSGAGNRTMISSDGVTWTSSAAAAANQWSSVTYGNGLYVAVSQDGTGNRVMTSIDGATWISRTSAANFQWDSVVYNYGMFISSGYDLSGNLAIMTSPNGITWTLVPNMPIATVGQTIIFSPTTMLVIGGGVVISYDGSTYTVQSGAPAVNYGTYGNGMFVGVGLTGGAAFLRTAGSNIMASGLYSDPNAKANPWIVLVGLENATFQAFGQTSRTISYPAGITISQQSTVVQANNFLFIFGGSNVQPIRWNGDWNGAFILAPPSTLGAGFQNIPNSNQATYCQNRLWIMQGKDTVSASQILDFANINVLTSAFDLNVGSSDYVVTSYPFGDTALVVFKSRSSYLLQNITGDLTTVTNTEITRQLGIIGINAVCSNGPDIIYMSDRNISSTRLNLQNKLQSVTQPLSRDIPAIMARVNWAYAYKVSMAFWNNQLFVSLPLDGSTVCNEIIVYNFILGKWYGEWNFNSSIGMNIQGFVIANYLSAITLHAVTEDGRIFAFAGGQLDISGNTVANISASLTTRAYRLDNNSHVPRRMYADIATNRPNLTIKSFADGVNESTIELSNQMYSRANSWLFNDAPYNLTNSNDDYNRAFRQDYSTTPASNVQCRSGFLPEVAQAMRLPLISRRKGRLSWFSVNNATGYIQINGIGMEARPGDRSSLDQVG